MARVSSANHAKIERAVELVRRVAPKLKSFTSADLFPNAADWQFTTPKAVGNVMKLAAKRGYIRKTDRVQTSPLPQQHGRPIAVWEAV